MADIRIKNQEVGSNAFQDLNICVSIKKIKIKIGLYLHAEQISECIPEIS